MGRNLKADRLFSTATKWRAEGERLRQILLGCELTEEIKWRKPCYTHDGNNIVIIQWMNDFLALLFFKGGLMRDPDDLLTPQGPHSRQGYRMTFTDVQQIEKTEPAIKAYIREAIRVASSGARPEAPDNPDLPEELLSAFAADVELKQAFARLTPGRQRGYVFHIADAKQAATRHRRIARHRDRIIAGKGHNER